MLLSISEAGWGSGIVDDALGFIRTAAGSDELSELARFLGEGIKAQSLISGIFLLVFSLLVCISGRRLMPLLRLLLFFAIGYVAAICFIAPMLSFSFEIPDTLTGIVCGAVAAVLSRSLYLILYLALSGGSAFFWIWSGGLVPALALNSAVGAIAAAVAVLLALYFRSYVEMLATALLGAAGATFAAELLLLPLGISLSAYHALIIIVLSLLGFLRQARTGK